MHTVSEMGTSVPAFLGKLWRLVEDPETDDLICWSPSGRSFFIRNQAQFARELLPHYYKHNNMASFVRQLNMYGFHKKVSVELGGLKCDRDEMEFAHQYFCKDHPYLLDHIKRKIASNKTQDPSQAPIKPELMNRMLTEVRSMRGRQEHFDSRLGAMKRENEALWRELALLRQKHLKQQQIVNKLIHFLVSLVQPNRNSGLSMKRRYPLMIDDSSRRLKQNKMSKTHQSPSGPAIHELDASDPDLDSEYIVDEMLENDRSPTIESPEHQNMTDDSIGEYYIDDGVQLQNEAEDSKTAVHSKKRCKGKKKGEETVMLEVPIDQVKEAPIPVALTTITNTNKPTSSVKPVPMATVRSSKLAAMAANLKKNQEIDLDVELEDYAQQQQEQQQVENSLKDPSFIKLENILIVPDVNDQHSPDFEDNSSNIAMPPSIRSLGTPSGSISNNSGSPQAVGENSPEANDMSSGTFGNIDFISSEGAVVNEETTSKNDRRQKNTKNKSLTCINQGNISESNYRLGSMEEVDTHLDSMQSELENLRELLRGEGYSIDANTLLGLFGAEDPMAFGFPVNPDLDPHANIERESDDTNHINVDHYSTSGNRGELMSYNTTTSLLDFDDDMFLGASSSSPTSVGADATHNSLANDHVDIIENKGNVFDSLIAANNGNSPQT